MRRVFLYNHTGGLNHGCEAIVRGTVKILGEDYVPIILASLCPQQDHLVGLDSIVNVVNHSFHEPLPSWQNICAKGAKKLTGTDDLYFRFKHSSLRHLSSVGDVALSIGGDNYCYGDCRWLYAANVAIRRNKTKTVFWGCSVDPDLIDAAMISDLNGYDHIVTRETITYQGMIDKGVESPISLSPDPAFMLDRINLPLPNAFEDGNTVGVNISPLIFKYAAQKDAVTRSVVGLLNHILQTTDFSIALIPHVTIPGSDDRTVLTELLHAADDRTRISIIDDFNAMELKGFISRCHMFIGARTHATIAAYSSGIPTLVLGYSIKSTGIARDIFGSEEGLVVPVQQIVSPEELVNAFDAFRERESDLRAHLEVQMPAYIRKAYEARTIIANL